MSKAIVRMVGGDSGGTEVWHDPEVQGPIVRMIKHPDFNSCDACMDHDMPATAVVHQEEYKIHLLRYDSGHRHYLAAPVRWRLVDLMNHLWHGYQTSEGKK